MARIMHERVSGAHIIVARQSNGKNAIIHIESQPPFAAQRLLLVSRHAPLMAVTRSYTRGIYCRALIQLMPAASDGTRCIALSSGLTHRGAVGLSLRLRENAEELCRLFEEKGFPVPKLKYESRARAFLTRIRHAFYHEIAF
ncbi:MAG: hypothetical protein SFW62_03015 [Alphaproteobacteria bacterium]|nr:hypothetical protein [Alphaproteobacteria bacterium]